MKKKLLIFCLLIFNFTSISKVFAQSGYVLPYPGAMPGSVFHKIHALLERIDSYWYFGNFAQFEYNLQQSDHYLVEAKTLFEYKQYLLATKALQKSTMYYKRVYPFLQKAKKEGKNIDKKNETLKSASSKHIEILTTLLAQTPKEFIWTPEKVLPTKLQIRKLIKESIETRNVRP